MNIKWLLVLVAGFFEVGWAAGLKHADSTIEWVLTVLAIAVSFGLLIYCSSQLPATTVYAAFVGLGTAGTVMLEMAVFGVPFSWAKIWLVCLLLTGIIGLKVVTVEKDVVSS
ncbi:DMT family transporter [Domibacillus enclensis]|uniref:Paired small multidrug resistance pump n=1 Tax=Domibacillus enclensis TaxID=1017273 RepID=A0A1N6WNH8_9BACI|nr:SMR family transporter [Domibacillus enclensis]OXS77992.1 QacE family quaternary ammonium compound efflux SMR transporter [Domibacillus enclensis]SIQ91617.1 paired small multidrug resistance pump [Domibacillus enclensis]